MWFWFFDWRARARKSAKAHVSKNSTKTPVIRVSNNVDQYAHRSNSNGLTKQTSREIQSSSASTIHRINKRADKVRRPTLVVSALVLLLAIGAALITKYLYFRAPPIQSVTSTQASEAEVIKRAIASKPAELREALSNYAETSPDIRHLLIQNLEEKNIGGAVAVAVANRQKNSDSGIDPPEQLGFSRIAEDKALVNRALKGEIDITKVTVSRAGQHIFEVDVEMKNNQGFPLECVIPKGQLVEIRNDPAVQENEVSDIDAATAQSPASSEKKWTIVPPYKPGRIKYTAYCANPDLAEPHGPANLAIYALADTSYNNWYELRELRKQQLHLAMRINERDRFPVFLFANLVRTR